MGFIGVPLTADFELNMPAMLSAIEKHKPAVIFLAYPNNPTGNLFAVEEIEHILRASDGLVVVDEAYYTFAKASFIERLREFNNLLVMRTLSKQGLAALRTCLLDAIKTRDKAERQVEMQQPLSTFLVDHKVQVSEGRPSDFEQLQADWNAKP